MDDLDQLIAGTPPADVAGGTAAVADPLDELIANTPAMANPPGWHAPLAPLQSPGPQGFDVGQPPPPAAAAAPVADNSAYGLFNPTQVLPVQRPVSPVAKAQASPTIGQRVGAGFDELGRVAQTARAGIGRSVAGVVDLAGDVGSGGALVDAGQAAPGMVASRQDAEAVMRGGGQPFHQVGDATRQEMNQVAAENVPQTTSGKVAAAGLEMVPKFGAMAITGGAGAPLVFGLDAAGSQYSKAMDAQMQDVRAGKKTIDEAHNVAAMEAAGAGALAAFTSRLPGLGSKAKGLVNQILVKAAGGGAQAGIDATGRGLVGYAGHGAAIDPKEIFYATLLGAGVNTFTHAFAIAMKGRSPMDPVEWAMQQYGLSEADRPAVERFLNIVDQAAGGEPVPREAFDPQVADVVQRMHEQAFANAPGVKRVKSTEVGSRPSAEPTAEPMPEPAPETTTAAPHNSRTELAVAPVESPAHVPANEQPPLRAGVPAPVAPGDAPAAPAGPPVQPPTGELGADSAGAGVAGPQRPPGVDGGDRGLVAQPPAGERVPAAPDAGSTGGPVLEPPAGGGGNPPEQNASGGASELVTRPPEPVPAKPAEPATAAVAPFEPKDGDRVAWTNRAGERRTGQVQWFADKGKDDPVAVLNGDDGRREFVRRSKLQPVEAAQAADTPAAPLPQPEFFPPKIGALSSPAAVTASPPKPPAATAAMASADSIDALAATPAHPGAPGRIQVDPLAGGEVKQIKDIVGDANAALDKQVRVARGEPKSKGVYYPGSTRTSIKREGDLDTYAHEALGHLVDDRSGLVGKYALGVSPFDAELIPHFSQFGSPPPPGTAKLPYQRAEGVAEWLRAWAINPAAAEAAAPQFYQHFIKTVPPELQAKVRAAGDDIRQRAGLEPHERAATNIKPLGEAPGMWTRAKAAIGRGPATGSTFRSNERDKAVVLISDALHPVMKAIDEARARSGNLAPLLPEDDPRITMRLLAGQRGRVEEMFDHGLRNWDGEIVKDGGEPVNVEWLFGPMDKTSRKALARDAQDAASLMVNERVLEKTAQLMTRAQEEALATAPGKTLAEALKDPKFKARYEAMMKAAKARAARLAGTGGGMEADDELATRAIQGLQKDPARYARLQEAARRYRAFADTLLTYAKEGGWIDQEAYDRIKDANEMYVDMHRVMDTLGMSPDLAPRVSGTRVGVLRPILHRFKGSTRQIENPYVNLLMQANRVYHEVDRNHAMDSFVDLLRSDRGMYEGEPVDLDAIGSQAKAGDPHALKIRHEGKTQFWQFDPEVYKALQNWGQVDNPGLIADIFRLPGKLTRFAVTRAPPFMARHAIRLTQEAAVKSDVGVMPTDLARPINADRKSRFRAFGGDQGADELPTTRDGYHRMMAKRIRQLSGERSTLLAIAGAAPRLYGKAVHWADAAIRIEGVFRRAYKRAVDQLGYDEKNANLYAAAEARKIMDYAKAGTATAQIGKYVPFTRARARGIVDTFSRLRADPRGTIARWAAFVLAPTLAAMLLRKALGNSEEEYANLPAWRRDFFYNFKVGPLWVSIPKPYELGVMASGVERAVIRASGDKHAMEGLAQSNVKALMPYDLEAPGALGVLHDMTANWSSFYGRHIIPPDDEGKDVSLRPGIDSASRIGQTIAGNFNRAGFAVAGKHWGTGVDARKVDYFVHQLLGGTANIASDVADAGREDRQPARFLNSGAGLTTMPPAYTAENVQRVMTEAQRIGDANSPQMRGLQAAVHRQSKAKGLADRDEQAKEVRARADFLEDFYDRHGDDLLELHKLMQGSAGDKREVRDAAPAQRDAVKEGMGERLDRAKELQKAAALVNSMRHRMEDVYDDSEMTPFERSRELKKLHAELSAVLHEAITH